jgi:hypothetical protein
MATLNILPLSFVLFAADWCCQKATDGEEYRRFGTLQCEKANLRLTKAAF